MKCILSHLFSFMRENFRNEESDSWKNKNYSADEDAGSERERRTGMKH